MKQNMSIDKTRIKVRTWLLEYGGILKYEAIDKKLDFPSGTIQKFVKYDRNMREERVLMVDEFIKDFLKF